MKLKLRLVLDLCMAVVVVICMNYQTTGNLPHEILGSALFLGIIIHIVANRKYYKAMIKKFKAKNEQSGKRIFTFVINALLLVLSVLMLFSSLVISKDVFVFVNLSILDYDIWRTVHIFSAVAFLVCGLVHLLLHMGLFKSLVKKSESASGNNAWNVCSKAAAVLMTAAVIPLSVRASVNALRKDEFYNTQQPESKPESKPLRDNSESKETTSSDNYVQNESVPAIDDISESVDFGQSTIYSQIESSEPYSEIIGSIESGTVSEDVQSQITDTVSEDVTVPTLDEYLGKLFCNGCVKHCSLLSPRCGKGKKNAEQETAAYYSEYGTIN